MPKQSHEDLVHKYSAKELKEFLSNYNISSHGIVEKADLAKLIQRIQLSNHHHEYFWQKIKERIESNTHGPSTSNGSPKDDNPLSEMFSNLFKSKKYQSSEASNPPNPSSFLNTMFGSKRDNRENSSNTPTPSEFVENIVHDLFEGTSQSTAQPSTSNASNQGHHRENSTYEHHIPPPSNREPSVPQSSETEQVPSLIHIMANKINLDTLTVKQLKKILLLERVSTQGILEKEELISKVHTLIDNIRGEIKVVEDDRDELLCKVSVF